MFVCAFFFLGSAEKVMRYCAENGDSAPKPIKRQNLRAMVIEVVSEKPFLAVTAIFLIMSIILS
jgi:hypothetical protein